MSNKIFRLHDICSGGVQQKVDDLLSKNNELWDLQNISFSKVGSISSQKLHATHTSGSRFDGIFELKKPGARELYRASGGDLQKYIGTWSTVTGGDDVFNTDTYVDFTSIIRISGTSSDSIVIATDSSVTKPVVAFDGTSVTDIEYASTGFKMYANCVGTLGNIAILGGVTFDDGVDTYTYKNRAYIAKPGTLQFWNDNETSAVTDSTRYAEVDGDIRSVEVINKYIAIFADAVTILNPETFELFHLSDYGAVNAGATVSALDALAWISYDGIYIWQGSGRPVKISRLISNVDKNGYWDYVQLDEADDFRAFVHEDSFMFYVIANTGSTDFGEVLEYDWSLKSWKRDVGYDVLCATQALIGNKVSTLIGDSSGLYKLREGTAYGSFVVETKNMYLEGADTKKDVSSIGLLYKSNTDKVTLEYAVDENLSEWVTVAGDGEEIELGDTGGIQTLYRLPVNIPDCSSVRLRFSCTDNTTYVDVSAIYISFRVTGTYENTTNIPTRN